MTKELDRRGEKAKDGVGQPEGLSQKGKETDSLEVPSQEENGSLSKEDSAWKAGTVRGEEGVSSRVLTVGRSPGKQIEVSRGRLEINDSTVGQDAASSASQVCLEQPY